MMKGWMNHDYTHCLDYTPKCPHSCFRAQLERDLKDRWTEFVGMPISYAHFNGDGVCQIEVDAKSEGMTNEDAISVMKTMIPPPIRGDGKSTTHLLQTLAISMAIDALQERKAGKWVKDEYGTDHCSCCDYIPAYDTAIDDIYYSPYCPNCGAKMEGDE